MGLISTLRRILNDTPGTATDIDYNFQTIEDHVNTELIQRDGSVAMTSPLVGVAAVNDNELVTKSQIDSLIPTGVILDFAAGDAKVPAGWEICDGRFLSSTDPNYEALFGVIGYVFGQSGSNFALPDLREKVTVGKGTGGAFNAVGETGGQSGVAAHAHTATFAGTALASHFHTMPTHDHGAGSYAVNISHDHGNTGANSRGHTHTVNPSSVFATLRNYAGSYVQSIKIFRDRRYIGSTDVSTAATDYVNAETYTSDEGASGDPESVRKFDVKVDVASTTTGGESQNHTHDVPALGTTNKSVTGTSGSTDPGDTNGKSAGTPAGTVTVASTGSGNNYPPYVIMNKIIKL